MLPNGEMVSYMTGTREDGLCMVSCSVCGSVFLTSEVKKNSTIYESQGHGEYTISVCCNECNKVIRS